MTQIKVQEVQEVQEFNKKMKSNAAKFASIVNNQSPSKDKNKMQTIITLIT